jgi:hypothetical protein
MSNKYDLCISTKKGHQKFIKKLIHAQIYGGICKICYQCGEQCHKSTAETFIIDNDSIEYKPGYTINKFVQLDSDDNNVSFKKINGKQYVVSGYRYVVPKYTEIKHNTSDKKTILLSEKQPINFSEVSRILYPVNKQYVGSLIDGNICYCIDHQKHKLMNTINNIISLSNNVNICKQCGHEHHSNSCYQLSSIIYPGVPCCSCSVCMCYNCLMEKVPVKTICCGVIYTEPTLDDLTEYIMDNAIPHKYLSLRLKHN